MNGKGAAKPDPRESGSRFRPIILRLACLALLVLICVPLLPLVALAVVLPRIINLIGASFLESLTAFMASLTALILLAAHSTWLLLLGDYAGLIRLGPQVIDWLRSAGLL